MKFFATLSLVALIAMPASVLAGRRPQLMFTTWDEENCRQNQRIHDDKALKPGECEDFDPFRSFQIVPYKRVEKLQDYCVLQVYSASGCKGQHIDSPSINKNGNVCTAATSFINEGVNSGRSVKVVCNKPAPAKSVQPSVPPTTTINIPIVPPPVSSTSKVEETKATVPLSPSAFVTTTTVSYLLPITTSVLTSQTLTISSEKPISTSTASTSTTWVAPSSASSTSTVWVSPPSTTMVISFTTAFGKNLPRPTKRAEEEAF